METNKTILTREVVSLEDRVTVGDIKDMVVDCDHNKIGHFIVSNALEEGTSFLAFDDIIAIGDSYVTIRSKNSLIPNAGTLAEDIQKRECRLLGSEMLAESGNHYGFLKGFEFDSKTGALTKLVAFDSDPVDSQGILFLSREYIFVGALKPLENVGGPIPQPVVQQPVAAPQPVQQPVAASQPIAQPRPTQPQPSTFGQKTPEPSKPASSGFQPAKPVSSAPSGFVSRPTPAPAPQPAPAAPSADAKDDLSDLLVGTVVGEDVASKDGQFSVKKGTTITEAILADAQKHDAALLLTMSIDI